MIVRYAYMYKNICSTSTAIDCLYCNIKHVSDISSVKLEHVYPDNYTLSLRCLRILQMFLNYLSIPGCYDFVMRRTPQK